MTAVTFGSRVRGLREPILSLTKLAGVINISPAYLSRVERDEATYPSERVIRRIADALDCDGDELCALAGRIPKEIHEYIVRNPKVLRRLRRETGKAIPS